MHEIAVVNYIRNCVDMNYCVNNQFEKIGFPNLNLNSNCFLCVLICLIERNHQN